MAIQIQLRRGTAAAWTAANTVLAEGEQALETDTKKRKLGDGVTSWTLLAYDIQGTGGAGNLSGPNEPTQADVDATPQGGFYAVYGDVYVPQS